MPLEAPVRVRLGLGALSNKHFDNALFPLRTPHEEYLPRYARTLDMLELDLLRGRREIPAEVMQWVQQSPVGFRFLPKLWKVATDPHQLEQPQPWDDAALDAARHSIDLLEPIREADRLGPVVVQFPPRFEKTEQHMDWLDDLLDMEPAGTFAIEVRHQSWNQTEVRDFLANRKTTLIWSLHPKAPQVDWATGEVGVVRLAGTTFPDAKSRGRPVTKRNRLEDLLALRKRIAGAPWQECFVSVLNPFEGNAIDSIPRVAGALVSENLGRRLSRKPGDALFKLPASGPNQSGLGHFD